MMTKQYQLQDAEQWAAFSGDNNPIHFSLQAAHQLGLNALCIHGMRAMLDIKAALSAQAQSALPQEQSLLFSCRLDKPVYYQRAYQFKNEQMLLNHRRQVRSTLWDEVNQEHCVQGKLAAVPAILPNISGENGQISGEEMAASFEALSAMTGQSLSLWNALDALLFRQLIHSPNTMSRVRAVLPELDCPNLMAIFKHIQVVQTHHETHFSSSLLPTENTALFDQPLNYSILPALVAGKSKNGFILQVSIQASSGKKALIKSSATLKTTFSDANENT